MHLLTNTHTCPEVHPHTIHTHSHTYSLAKFMLVLKFLVRVLAKKFVRKNLSNSSCKNFQHSHKLNNNFLSQFRNVFALASALAFVEFPFLYFALFPSVFCQAPSLTLCGRPCWQCMCVWERVWEGVAKSAYVKWLLAKCLSRLFRYFLAHNWLPVDSHLAAMRLVFCLHFISSNLNKIQRDLVFVS